MTTRQEVLDKLAAAHREYEQAQVEAEQHRQRRDALVLEATRRGSSRAELSVLLGLTRARVQQLVDRARSASPAP
jgi:hypothetical protein